MGTQGGNARKNCQNKVCRFCNIAFCFSLARSRMVFLTMRYRTVLLALLAGIPAIAAGTPEREVAEWAIRAGGRVTIEGRPTALTDPADLPNGDLRIVALDLTNTLIDPTDLRRISGLTAIRDLYLPGPSWNPASGSRLDANEELKSLSELVTLERLYFSVHFLPNINVRDKGLAYLGKLTKLRDLRLAQCRVQAPDLSGFQGLQSLDVSYTTFNDAGMKTLQGLKEVRRLILRDTLITDEGLQHLQDMPNLEELDLYGTKVTDAGLAHLRKLTTLKKLNVLGTDVSDESAAIFAGFPHLRELNLYRSRLTNTGLSSLASLKELTALDVRYSRVTGTGVESLQAALPHCKIDFVGATVSASAASGPAHPQGSG